MKHTDTTTTGQITDESCSFAQKLLVSVNKTKELIVDLKRKKEMKRQINGAEEEQIDFFLVINCIGNLSCDHTFPSQERKLRKKLGFLQSSTI